MTEPSLRNRSSSNNNLVRRSVNRFTGVMAAGAQNFTERIFPEAQNLPDSSTIQAKRMIVSNSEIASDVILQQSLYYNVIYSCVFFVLQVSLLAWKQKYLDYNLASKILDPTLFSIWCVMEPVRLFFGYTGNLQEKVPYLSGFWGFTIIPQLPLAIYFLALRQHVFPLDTALGSIMLTFIGLELIVGYRALSKLIKSQVIKFNLQKHKDEQRGVEMSPVNWG